MTTEKQSQKTPIVTVEIPLEISENMTKRRVKKLIKPFSLKPSRSLQRIKSLKPLNTTFSNRK